MQRSERAAGAAIRIAAVLIAFAATIAASALLAYRDAQPRLPPVEATERVSTASGPAEWSVEFAGARVCREASLIPARPEEVFRIISDLESYPGRFPSVRSVDVEKGYCRWSFSDPTVWRSSLGTNIVRQASQRALCWSSDKNSPWPFRGRIACRSVDPGWTRVEIVFAYELPDQVFGQSMIDLVGIDPDELVDGAMWQYLEQLRWEMLLERQFGAGWRQRHMSAAGAE